MGFILRGTAAAPGFTYNTALPGSHCPVVTYVTYKWMEGEFELMRNPRQAASEATTDHRSN